MAETRLALTLGYLHIDRQDVRLLFQVVSKCYKRRSLIATTNLESLGWDLVFTDDQMAAALIGRIVLRSSDRVREADEEDGDIANGGDDLKAVRRDGPLPNLATFSA